ncbi:hypothetical protein [Shewanella piezotolerans]|uniref:hypothetical protein n=1 Tax=Shewanella piezotolerans TaxID=404011 RepID=UPI0002D73398|nr:hypothetical protein [Shewanella piezotolerans]
MMHEAALLNARNIELETSLSDMNELVYDLIFLIDEYSPYLGSMVSKNQRDKANVINVKRQRIYTWR